MIQRIQTIYLLVVAVLMTATVFSPLLSFVSADVPITLYTLGWESKAGFGNNTWGIITFSAVAALSAFSAIFLYKNRKAQMRLCKLILLFIFIFYTAIFAYTYTGMEAMHLTLVRIGSGSIFPFCAFVFCILALQKIKADEKLVKSLDRIR